MSHTGRVNERAASPGLIRIVTTGCFFDNKSLFFRKPEGPEAPAVGQSPSSNVTPEEWLKAAQERFIPYIPRNDQDPVLGQGQGQGNPDKADTVCFSMELFESWEDIVKSNLHNEYEVAFKGLKDKLPTQWKNVLGSNFEFKYIARDVRKVKPQFVLNAFFEKIKQDESEAAEESIKHLGLISVKKDRIKFKGSKPREVDIIAVLDAEGFDERVSDYDESIKQKRDFATANDVLKDIHGPNKRHQMSTEDEIPTSSD